MPDAWVPPVAPLTAMEASLSQSTEPSPRGAVPCRMHLPPDVPGLCVSPPAADQPPIFSPSSPSRQGSIQGSVRGGGRAGTRSPTRSPVQGPAVFSELPPAILPTPTSPGWVDEDTKLGDTRKLSQSSAHFGDHDSQMESDRRMYDDVSEALGKTLVLSSGGTPSASFTTEAGGEMAARVMELERDTRRLAGLLRKLRDHKNQQIANLRTAIEERDVLLQDRDAVIEGMHQENHQLREDLAEVQQKVVTVEKMYREKVASHQDFLALNAQSSSQQEGYLRDSLERTQEALSQEVQAHQATTERLKGECHRLGEALQRKETERLELEVLREQTRREQVTTRDTAVLALPDQVDNEAQVSDDPKAQRRPSTRDAQFQFGLSLSAASDMSRDVEVQTSVADVHLISPAEVHEPHRLLDPSAPPSSVTSVALPHNPCSGATPPQQSVQSQDDPPKQAALVLGAPPPQQTAPVTPRQQTAPVPPRQQTVPVTPPQQMLPPPQQTAP
eukprot:Hpha_TRINITY_DN16906_c1_g5::TRINITY_DN16906_c1_g5_i3::g.55281::m.55281